MATVKRIGDKAYGIYRTTLQGKDSRRNERLEEGNSYLLAYKAMASVLDLNPDDYPNAEELAALEF